MNTVSGLNCIFPFTYGNISYTRCTLDGPNNPSQLPQCLVGPNTWSFCQGILLSNYHFIDLLIIINFLVPTNAIINYVTTRKSGSSSQNGASVNGDTLVWIYGQSKN